MLWIVILEIKRVKNRLSKVNVYCPLLLMRKLFIGCLFCIIPEILLAQRSVAITIDDVPNIQLFESDYSKSLLQKQLDSLHIPVAIFINEGNLGQPKATEKNKQLLKSWLSRDYITAGNHGFIHKNYADAGFDAFTEDVNKGEVITKELLRQQHKDLKYFRFPFNSLGNDSLEQVKAEKFLNAKNYISTPFTVESEDYMFAGLYDKALAENNKKLAQDIGNQYVAHTLNLFSYFDSLSIKQYGRSVKQIYLCHDNALNANYLAKLIEQLKKKDYNCISLDEAISDPVYKSREYYFGKYGFSWIYRWMPDVTMRKKIMRTEPTNAEIQKMYEAMNQKN
jgi:peptidoglycan/xylan/chitin deacetylase (PgdA/CDA1 family)